MNKTWATVIVVIILFILGYGGYRLYNHYHRLALQAAPSSQPTKTAQAFPTATSSASVNIVKMISSGKLGSILTDTKGLTLYTYTRDTTGVSNCTGGCLKIWPAYVAPSSTANLPANLSIFKRPDGTYQYAWKGRPLYYFNEDTKPGDVNGQGVGGVWFVAK